jgi:hypothetical protein
MPRLAKPRPLRHRFVTTLVLLAALAGCETVQSRLGVNWEHSYRDLGSDTYRITAKESRFANSGDSDQLFRAAAQEIVAAKGCRDYQVLSYFIRTEPAFPASGRAVVEGDIRCLRGPN